MKILVSLKNTRENTTGYKGKNARLHKKDSTPLCIYYKLLMKEIDLRSLICIDGNFVTLHAKTSSNKKWGLHQVLLINQLKASGVDITTFAAVNSDPENISRLQTICKHKVLGTYLTLKVSLLPMK